MICDDTSEVSCDENVAKRARLVESSGNFDHKSELVEEERTIDYNSEEDMNVFYPTGSEPGHDDTYLPFTDQPLPSNVDSFEWLPAASSSEQPFALPPWYANGLRMASVGAPRLPGPIRVPGMTDSDVWWNTVDSQTWLMGLQNYLYLNSLPGLGLCLQLISPPPNLIYPSSVVGGPNPWFLPSVQQQSDFTDVSGLPYVLRNGTDSREESEEHRKLSQTVCQPFGETFSKHESTSSALIDLVNFMHSYCLPPSRTSTSVPPVEDLVSTSDRNRVTSEWAGGGVVAISRTSQPAAAVCSPLNSTTETGLQSMKRLRDAASIHTDSDTDSAVVSTVGCRSSASSTASCSSSMTENWLDDDRSNSQSPLCCDAVRDQAKCESSVDSAVTCASDASPEVELTTPGWFGKGFGSKLQKKRKNRRDSR